MQINKPISNHNPYAAVAPNHQTPPLSSEQLAAPLCEQPPADELQSTTVNQGQALTSLSLEPQSDPKIEGYLKQLDPLMAKGRLKVREKKQVLKILRNAKKEGHLPALATAMDEKKTLSSLYYKMKIPHKPNDGRFAIPIQLSGGGTFVLTQANFPNYAPDTDFEDRSGEFKKLLKKGDVAPEILNKLY